MNQIRKVERAARKLSEAGRQLEDAIRFSHTEGASLRQLAKAAGMSHEKVRGLISRDQASGR